MKLNELKEGDYVYTVTDWTNSAVKTPLRYRIDIIKAIKADNCFDTQSGLYFGDIMTSYYSPNSQTIYPSNPNSLRLANYEEIAWLNTCARLGVFHPIGMPENVYTEEMWKLCQRDITLAINKLQIYG